MNKHYHHNTILLLLTLIFGLIFGSQLHVRYDDPIYDYLDRMETQGILPVYMNGTLPLSRDYIVDMLIHLEGERDKLSTIDIKFWMNTWPTTAMN